MMTLSLSYSERGSTRNKVTFHMARGGTGVEVLNLCSPVHRSAVEERTRAAPFEGKWAKPKDLHS